MVVTRADTTVEGATPRGSRRETRAQKERRAEHALAERQEWVEVFTRLGDGRQNRGADPEARKAYRHAAAMLNQNVRDPEGVKVR